MKPTSPRKITDLDRAKQDRLLRVLARLIRERERRETDALRDLGRRRG